MQRFKCEDSSWLIYRIQTMRSLGDIQVDNNTYTMPINLHIAVAKISWLTVYHDWLLSVWCGLYIQGAIRIASSLKIWKPWIWNEAWWQLHEDYLLFRRWGLACGAPLIRTQIRTPPISGQLINQDITVCSTSLLLPPLFLNWHSSNVLVAVLDVTTAYSLEGLNAKTKVLMEIIFRYNYHGYCRSEPTICECKTCNLCVAMYATSLAWVSSHLLTIYWIFTHVCSHCQTTVIYYIANSQMIQ